MNPKIERLKTMAEELRAMFPGKDPELWAHLDGRIDLALHNAGSYAESTLFFRELGIGERSKQVFDPEKPWFCVSGTADGVVIKFFGHGLPESCHVETYTEKIPREQVSTTNEWAEVQRTRIVCGEKEGA